jgi:hypothetical protein
MFSKLAKWIVMSQKRVSPLVTRRNLTSPRVLLQDGTGPSPKTSGDQLSVKRRQGPRVSLFVQGLDPSRLVVRYASRSSPFDGHVLPFVAFGIAGLQPSRRGFDRKRGRLGSPQRFLTPPPPASADEAARNGLNAGHDLPLHGLGLVVGVARRPQGRHNLVVHALGPVGSHRD